MKYTIGHGIPVDIGTEYSAVSTAINGRSTHTLGLGAVSLELSTEDIFLLNQQLEKMLGFAMGQSEDAAVIEYYSTPEDQRETRTANVEVGKTYLVDGVVCCSDCGTEWPEGEVPTHARDCSEFNRTDHIQALTGIPEVDLDPETLPDELDNLTSPSS